MKLCGFLMVTVGFIGAALAAVVSESLVRWDWYIPALAVGVAGVVVIRTREARRRTTTHRVAANIETVQDSL
ncbi:MAG: hypothetical protein ACODAD_07785, partial [Planctomycetota bacterium]